MVVAMVSPFRVATLVVTRKATREAPALRIVSPDRVTDPLRLEPPEQLLECGLCILPAIRREE
jgi:hypothetical protein